jgi:hypothetical protein
MITLAFLMGVESESLRTTKLRAQTGSGGFFFFSPAERHRGTMRSRLTRRAKRGFNIFLMVSLCAAFEASESPE